VNGVERTFSKAFVSAARPVDGIFKRAVFLFFENDNMLGIL
jgi:hypothetical protein